MSYDVSYKILKRFLFNKLNGFIRSHNGTKYLVLIGPEQCDAILDKTIYLIGLKIGITDVFPHSYEKIKIDSDDDLLL